MTVLPTLTGVSYGPHERNVSDVPKAPTEGEPTRVFVWRHSGGICSGDKTQRTPKLAAALLDRGISVVAPNYRVSRAATFSVPYHECQRALQFARRSADYWGLDES
jgi:acetyl esterase/lipase